jgi:hypothetical protein
VLRYRDMGKKVKQYGEIERYRDMGNWRRLLGEVLLFAALHLFL